MNKAPDIYQYDNISRYLGDFLEYQKKSTHGRFNLNFWSSKLGYRSPRAIAMVLKDQRAPSEALSDKLVEFLELTGAKKRYLRLLRKKSVLEHKGQCPHSVNEELHRLNPENLNFNELSELEFSYISEWQNLVIKQLTKVKSFIGSPEWIAKKLKNKVTPSSVAQSLELLVKLGHLKRVKNNCYEVTEPIRTGRSIASEAIKKNHHQILTRAQESLYEDSVSERFFYSVCLKFDRDHVKEASEMIQEFAREFDARFSNNSQKQEDVYQLAVQLFPHTTKQEG